MSSSILTNSSSMAALQTLRSINDSLEMTQNRISSGMKVSEASDNAAYWSIATTMKSDNKSLSTVSDALGLGASTVDVAYTGTDSIKNTLDDIKSRLVAAKQPGVDKSKIQSEISSLQNTIKSIADSASFSGSNWLSINSDAEGFNKDQDIVSSLTRGSDGQISLGKITTDVTKTALFDAGEKGTGLLDKTLGNTSEASLAADTATGTAATAATAGGFTTGDIDLSGLVATDKITLNVAVDGGTAQSINVAVGADLDALATNLSGAITGGSVSADGGKLTFKSDATGTSSDVDIDTIAFTDTGGTAKTPSPSTGFADVDGTAGADAVAAAGATLTTGTDFSAITLDENDSISFDVALDGGDATTVTINKATVDAALSSTDGAIADAASFATVLTQGLSDAGVTGVTAAANGSKIDFAYGSDENATLDISNVEASNGGNAFGVTEIDITKDDVSLDDYIRGVDEMISNVTSQAADLGATKSQIDNQDDFVSNLMDAIDRGVGRLVDADMNEESTKLKALQTQQQLGVQALSIANSSSQSILSLFR